MGDAALPRLLGVFHADAVLSGLAEKHAPLGPEFIAPQEGADKQDSELLWPNAGLSGRPAIYRRLSRY